MQIIHMHATQGAAGVGATQEEEELWVPDWRLVPGVIDFMPIWYEVHNNKHQLPDGMDRSFSPQHIWE